MATEATVRANAKTSWAKASQALVRALDSAREAVPEDTEESTVLVVVKDGRAQTSRESLRLTQVEARMVAAYLATDPEVVSISVTLK